jgi:hypothetical protein
MPLKAIEPLNQKKIEFNIVQIHVYGKLDVY